MQKFLILGNETFAWNSSHRRGSGPQTQTQTVNLFRIRSFKLSLIELFFLSTYTDLQKFFPTFQCKIFFPTLQWLKNGS